MRVKICGITSPGDARAAEAAGADAIGLIFAPDSVRYLSLDLAAEICAAVGPLVTTVAVFRDAPLRDVLRVVEELPVGAVQLHGRVDDDHLDEVGRSLPVIRALSFTPGMTRQELEEIEASALLLDGSRPGSGEAFDWGEAQHLSGMPRLILAGGLDPKNVARGIGLLKPYAVDVSSGVESSRGVKDRGLIREFVLAARAATGEAVA